MKRGVYCSHCWTDCETTTETFIYLITDLGRKAEQRRVELVLDGTVWSQRTPGRPHESFSYMVSRALGACGTVLLRPCSTSPSDSGTGNATLLVGDWESMTMVELMLQLKEGGLRGCCRTDVVDVRVEGYKRP
jgi:hypothetical protein